jgi:D-alanyl-D-alanine carboxypeptidase
MFQKLRKLKIVKLFFSQSFWLYRILPACLIFLGVIINIYALANRILPYDQNQSSRVISPPPLTTSEPNSSQPVATTPNINIPNSPSGISPRFGHLPYADAKVEELIVISSYGQQEYQRFERLMPDAALALMKMMYAARDDGIWIIPASAFRDFKKQQELFDKQVQMKGSLEEAAKSVAPPGYSEHHTGYAVDLVDGYVPNADINNFFAETKAFQWLTQRAEEFGYELSFPKNNLQSVKYEPWHWRFVASSEAAEIFRDARN